MSTTRPIARSSIPATAAGGRYQVVRAIGRGGMAQVYEVVDAAEGGKRLALKRLQRQPDATRQRRNAELFEREFHTLAQLAHPRVVQVYEFGIDDVGPHYTMELLDGGDLQQLAPLPWREACAVARDMCSALSLLHSRRLVHRDVSPRNVRRTAEGWAKLIDFGALTPVGPSKILVGTPPCCAPESLQQRPLDGRTDLYALGATLYYLLSGQHAYAARDFHELPDLWRAGVTRLSQRLPDLPPALDTLLLDLLRLEPDARPANAAEVLQRLAAIDGAAADDQLVVARAYLSTPTLVGRDDALARVRRRLAKLTTEGACSVLIEGRAGVGRSRFLDVCLLEASLHGLGVLRADADDASSGPYGVVRSLARQLLATQPSVALPAAQSQLAALASVVPELAERAGVAEGPAPDLAAQTALRDWFGAISRAHPLVLGLDDFHAFDEPSAAVLALLAVEPGDDRIGVIASAESGARGSGHRAQQLLSEVSTRLPLDELDAVQSHALFESLFGDVPHLGLLSERARGICGGNPRDLLRLAQHLIDRGSLHYDAGAWTLPAQFDSNELPSSMAEALRARVASLPNPVRALACALALCSDESFSFDECASLHGTQNVAALQRDLDALIRAEIVRYRDGKFGLTHASWVAPLSAMLSPELTRTLDRRLAEVFESRGDAEFLAGQYWLRAGKLTHGLDVLVRYAEQVARDAPPLAMTSARGFHTPARDWRETYELALRACDELGRPRRERHVLRHRMTALCSLLGQHDTVQLPKLLAELAECSGLSDYAALDPSRPHLERLHTSFTAAQRRYEAADEQDRLFDPRSAIRELVRGLSITTGIAAQAWDLAFLRAAPDITPFQSLAPAIETVNMLVHGLERRLTGSLEQAADIYRELLRRLERPDHGGLDASNAGYTQAGMLNMLGLIEAGSGLDACLSRIDALQKLPAFAVNALLLRMLHALYQGDVENADACRRQAARVRVQAGGRPIYGSLHLIWELHAHAISEDLTRIRHVLEEITPLAKRFPGWQLILSYGSAEYHRLRRSPAKALLEIEATLRQAPPGAHQVWCYVAVCHVLVLLDLGRHADALAQARENLDAARRELGELPAMLQLVLGFAEAQIAVDAAQPELAAQASLRADAVIAQLTAAGVSGIHLGFAHELRARIAALSDDTSSFERHADACRVVYLAHKHPALAAKYERLFQTAAQPGAIPDLPDASVEGRIVAALERCHTPAQRAQLALTALLQNTGSCAGVLFTCGNEALECAAQIGDVGDLTLLRDCVSGYVSLQLTAADVTLTGDAAKTVAAVDLTSEPGRNFRPVALNHTHAGRTVVAGIAVLALAPNRPPFVHPTRLASGIARVLAQSGDSSLLELSE